MTWPTSPRKWELTTGTWGTDADRDETTVLTGNASAHMKSTAVATALRSGWIPIEGNIYYHIWTLVQTDDITAGYNAQIRIQEYGADKSTLVFETLVESRVPRTANVWEWIGGEWIPNGTARWGKIIINKTANAHNLYWDRVHLEKIRPGFLVYRSSVESIGSGSWTPVTWNVNKYGSTGAGRPWNFYRALLSSGAMQLPQGGQWSLGAAVELEDPASACDFNIRIKHNVPLTLTHYYYGTKFNSDTARLVVNVPHLYAYGAARGETFEVEVWQNSGGALNVLAATSSSVVNYFSGHRIQPI